MLHTAKKIIALVLTAALCLSLSSCYDSVSIEDMAYIIAIGIDQGKDDSNKKYTLQFVKPLEFVGKGSGDSNQGNDEKENVSKNSSLVNLTLYAPTVFDALKTVSLSLAKKPDLNHAKLIVISDKVAEKGVDQQLKTLISSNEFRTNLYVAVCAGDCEQYLANINSPLQKNPAHYYDVIFGSSTSPYLPSVYLKDFYFKTQSEQYDAVVPLVAVKEMKSSDDVTTAFGKDKNTRFDAKAGEGITYSEVDSEATGMAVFRDGVMISKADGGDAFGYSLIKGTAKPFYMTLHDVQTPNGTFDKLTLYIEQRRKPRYKVILSGGVAQITVNLNLDGSYAAFSEQLDIPTIKQQLQDTITQSIKTQAEDILRKSSTEYQADVFGFGSILKMQYLTLDQWEEIDWHKLYKDAQFTVNVSLNMRRPSRLL